MSYKIIVARYKEDINWLNSEMDNCIIYNKGEKLNIENEIFLENVGRESHTYLHYIITNYNNLPDIVIFTQAKISDHRGSDDVNYLIQLKNEANSYNKSISPLTHYQWDINSRNCWDREWNIGINGELLYYSKENFKNCVPISFWSWFEKNINLNYPNPINIYMNGIFAVKKELILKNHIDYYKNLILEINHHSDPVEGAFFERSWYYIFNLD